jgi:hypothetical protein
MPSSDPFLSKRGKTFSYIDRNARVGVGAAGVVNTQGRITHAYIAAQNIRVGKDNFTVWDPYIGIEFAVGINFGRTGKARRACRAQRRFALVEFFSNALCYRCHTMLL